MQWFSKVEGALAIAEQDKSLRKNHEQVSWPTREFIWFHAVWRIPNPGNKLGLPWMIWDMINERNMTEDADVSDTTRYNTYIYIILLYIYIYYIYIYIQNYRHRDRGIGIGR